MPDEWAVREGNPGSIPTPPQPQLMSTLPLPVPQEILLFCGRLHRDVLHGVLGGECWPEVGCTPGKARKYSIVPPPAPTPCLVPAVPGTASIELVCSPRVRRARTGRAHFLLRLIQHPCPRTATSRTLCLPLPAAGEGPCQAGSMPRAGLRQGQGEGKSDPTEV